jgi:glycosyltransferase involved in cell wall biosynthesis
VITGRNFVVFADDWGRHPSSAQHLFRRLAPRNRVTWVNTIGTRTPTLSRSDLSRAVGKLREWTTPARGASASSGAPPGNPAGDDVPVRVLRPFMVPFPGKALRRFNAARIERTVRADLPAGADPGPLLVTTIPNVADVVGRLGESLAVYYCVDEFSEWPGADRRSLLSMEAELLEKVDLVVATSERLFESKSARHPRVRLLRHGVDWDRFRSGSGTVPPSLAAFPEPLVGFVGLADARLDVPLVAALARARPALRFVFVGPRQLPEGVLDAAPNVVFLPSVPYEDVPAVLARFRVSMLPYVENELTERINPLKLRELLAAGRPVVATPLPEVVRFAPHVRTPRGVDDWIAAIDDAMGEEPARAGERSACVRDESWETRAEEFSRLCREAELAGRGSR